MVAETKQELPDNWKDKGWREHRGLWSRDDSLVAVVYGGPGRQPYMVALVTEGSEGVPVLADGSPAEEGDEYRCWPTLQEALVDAENIDGAILRREIERAAALLKATREGYPVHVGCGGEVDGAGHCHSCEGFVPRADVVGPSDSDGTSSALVVVRVSFLRLIDLLFGYYPTLTDCSCEVEPSENGCVRVRSQGSGVLLGPAADPAQSAAYQFLRFVKANAAAFVAAFNIRVPAMVRMTKDGVTQEPSKEQVS